ncbi:MAG: NnrU family protein [Cypionkella sp.]
MLLLGLGVLLWAYSHLMKRVTPGFRAKLGDGPGKGVAAVLALLALYLMITGYRSAEVIVVWSPPAFMRHINNLLMLIAVILLFMQANRGGLRTLMRHPMLAAVKTWALAHLLVNGDLASIILFGGLLAWAVLDMILINKMEPAWTRPAKGPVINDVIYVVAALVGFAAIVWVHTWMGYPPLG